MASTHQPLIAAAPILVQRMRGYDHHGQAMVECIHRGLIAVIEGSGQRVYSVGDISTQVPLRSCAKPFQLLALLKHLDHPYLQALDLEHIALMMSSHAGEPIHTAGVEQILGALNLKESHLRCGAHPPEDEATRCALRLIKEKPNQLHNNCSGKHAAMLMACKIENLAIDRYEDLNHPLQQEIKAIIEDLADLKEQDLSLGTDGCSLPTFIMPLENLALMYARLSYWRTHPPDNKPPWLKGALEKMWSAAVGYPQFLAGSSWLDTQVIEMGQGQIFCKTGADGMQALAISPCDRFPQGLGIAIKIVDGDAKRNIRPLVIEKLLEHLKILPAGFNLEHFFPATKNFRGLEASSNDIHLL